MKTATLNPQSWKNLQNGRQNEELSGIGMAALLATGGAGNLFTATLLLIISATCLYFGKAFSEETWE